MTAKPASPASVPAKTTPTQNGQQNQNDTGEAGKALRPLEKTALLVNNYAKRLLDDKRAQQFAATLALMVKRDPKLATCTQDSLLASLMACVHLDLMPNTPEQLAFIIPYKNRQLNVMQAQFQVGYKGMVALAYRSAGISSINAELVFPQDTFEVDFATRKMTHKPDLTIDRTKYADAKAVYAVAIMGNGQQTFDVLSRSEIEKIRETVKAKSSGTPWKDWEEAMVKKTAIKRLTKLLPQSAKDNRLQFAAAYDSWAEVGKLKVDSQGELVQGEPERPAIDHDQIKKDAAKVAADLAEGETIEGNDPHREAEQPPANPDVVIEPTDEDFENLADSIPDEPGA